MLSRIRGQRRLRPTSAEPAPLPSLLTLADLTYLGAYAVPRTVNTTGDTRFARGLTIRYEPSDTGNEVHLISYAGGVFEFRDRAPENPVTPQAVSSYTEATVVKEYGDVFSGKYLELNGGVEGPAAEFDGYLGWHWDDPDSRLYWTYGKGYSGDSDSWCLGYSTLNYAAGTGTGHGPWRFYSSGSGQSWKALMGGICPIPQSYADTHLGGKRLAIGFGGYFSVIQSADASMGPSLTAIDPVPGGATEKTDLASTPLLGYWPYNAEPGAGRGRCNRPATATGMIDPAWPLSKWGWNDRVYGGVWIETANKRGVLFAGIYSLGRTEYVSSRVPSSGSGHFLSIYDSDDFTPVSGTPRYEIQPTEMARFEFPTNDYAAHGDPFPSKSVTGIASDSGKLFAAADGCTVACPSHGFVEGAYIEIIGADGGNYDGIYEIPEGGGVINANSFHLRNISRTGNWSGVTPGGTITSRNCSQEFTVPIPAGTAFDPLTRKVYIMVSSIEGVNNLNGKPLVHVYQVP